MGRGWGHATKRIVLLLAVLVALGFVPVHAQEEDKPDVVFQVTVLYDPDGDGIMEGVGAGVVVNARELSKSQGDIQITDSLSSAFFSLNTGLHRVTAFPKSTRFLYEWVCAETVFVSDTNDKFVLRCEEKFFMRFPWTLS